MSRVPFRSQHGHAERAHGYWWVHYQKYLLVDGKITKKRVRDRLCVVVPERDGCMLLPPGLVLAAQNEYMRGVNEENRKVVIEFNLATGD